MQTKLMFSTIFIGLSIAFAHTHNVIGIEYALDKSFGNNGVVIADLGIHSGSLNLVVPSIQVIVQPDGKILLVGDMYSDSIEASYLESRKCNMVVLRYHNNGTLDTSFGNQGITIVSEGTKCCTHDCALQQDGKIILVGKSYERNGVFPDATIVRLNQDGTLDRSFGNDGIIIDTLQGKDWTNFFKVIVRQDDTILAAGNYGTATQDDYSDLNCCFYLVHFHKNGERNTAFGNDGIIKTVVTNNNRLKPRKLTHAADVVLGTMLQANGKIIIVGSSEDWSYNHDDLTTIVTPYSDCVIARYTIDGSLDSSFGNDDNGIVITSASTMGSFFVDVKETFDHKIIALGTALNSVTQKSEFCLVRYTTDGIIDTSFGKNKNGIVLTPIGTDHAIAKKMVIQNDGKILVTGVVRWQDRTKFTLVRYTHDGLLDTTFGPDNTGVITIALRDNETESKSIALATQDDGKILVAGDSLNGDRFDFALVRLCAS